eukprot:3974734-Amphidinium_carterae.2
MGCKVCNCSQQQNAVWKLQVNLPRETRKKRSCRTAQVVRLVQLQYDILKVGNASEFEPRGCAASFSLMELQALHAGWTMF